MLISFIHVYQYIYGHTDKLQNSQYDNPVILDELINEAFVQQSDNSVIHQTAWLKIGNHSENNVALGIRGGALRING